MKKLLLILAIVLCASTRTVSAGDGWQWAANTLVVADWAQTRYIADNPESYFEINPIMGKHPSKGEVDQYFIVSLILLNAVGESVPSEYRNTFYKVITGM